MLIGFYLNKFKKEKILIKNFLIFIITISLLSVILTGERSNSIKFALSLFIFFSMIDFLSLKKIHIIDFNFYYIFYNNCK